VIKSPARAVRGGPGALAPPAAERLSFTQIVNLKRRVPHDGGIPGKAEKAMAKRRICVVTGTRAEFGLLYWLMKGIQGDPDLELRVIATGMHLSPEFGLTFRAIEEAGLPIDRRVEMLLSSDTAVGVAKSIGLGVIGFADALDSLRPDILVVLGDRYEILAAAQAAMVARIPVAHIHGGEATEGLIDEPIRHCVTKMSHYHFAAAEPYRRRIIQLGEDPARVFNFGAVGLDNIHRLRLLERDELARDLGFDLGKAYFLVTYHPVTLGDGRPAEAMASLFAALDAFPDARVVFTKPNSDADGRAIAALIDAYVAARPGRAIARTSLGQVRYLSAMRHAAAVVGNSSSGLIEAPEFRVPTVNVGDRQRGRLKAASVLDCAGGAAEVEAAIRAALAPAFRASLAGMVSPYHGHDVAGKILSVLRTAPLEGIVMKRFHDLGAVA
jgi:UDP-hydrolysing UDP-N-acetyl-D-glucosamine 2-epimerase